MSSKPKILIAPKKKKKKPLIIVSKKKSVGGGASSTARPASPNTVAAAAADTTATSLGGAAAGGGGAATSSAVATNKSKKSKSSILIKPFSKPPSLPPDFYDSSLEVLRRALTCVLRHEALLASNEGGANDVNAKGSERRLIGREELYRSVEDLCVHKFGTKLYYDAVQIMEESAGEVVRRLFTSSSNATGDEEGHSDSSLDAILDRVSGNVGYNASQLINDLNLKDGGVCNSGNDTSMGGSNEESYSEKRHRLLQRMHTTCRVSYAEEYLTFVRSIFLALDRAFIYYSDKELEEIDDSVSDENHDDLRKRQLKSPSAAMEVDAMDFTLNNTTTSIKSRSSPPGGKVMERSSASSNSRVWGLWEVGIACLRRHMACTPHATKAPPSSDGSPDMGTLSVLTTMVLTTAYAILSEYDHNYNVGGGDTMMGNHNRPLLRNCVRTIIDLGSLPSLLEELIVVASTRFSTEGVSWGMALSENKRSAPEFLVHVEMRLRQSNNLSGYYLPGSGESVNALRRLSKRESLTGAVPSSTVSSTDSPKKVTWSPANNSTRRIFPAIIEKQLLGPHLLVPTAGILEPRHLYAMLDDDSGGGGDMAWKPHSGIGSSRKTYENAKRLYGLCWRMTASASSTGITEGTSPQKSSSCMMNPAGPSSALDHLRLAFGEYGRLRGADIIKQGLPPKQSSSSAAADGSTPIPANNNNKEMEKKIIPDLLSFKSHLYSLLTIAFRNENSFASMVRSILEDVLNGADNSSSIADDGDGSDGGRRIAELLAKHVDMRFKDAKASASPSATAQQVAHVGGGDTGSNLLSAAIATDANESFQSEILALFRHIHSKDVFEAFYKRDLAKRLLTGRAVSTDMERSFLTKLKAECGAGYTSKMEGMFKDMELSRDIMGSYTAYSAGTASSSAAVEGLLGGKIVDMDVQVLTTGYWPVYPKYDNIILPPELLTLRTKFETYYNDKYQGRRIVWQYSLGHCIIKASFPKSPVPKELVVNLCQSLVLLCFRHEDGEDGMGLALEDIAKKTGIEDRGELERVLQSLSLGKIGTRVLKKVDYDSPTQPASPSKTVAASKDGDSPQKAKKQRARRNVGPHDRFIFNAAFTSNQRRIRITNITMKETSEERTKTHTSVSKDRLYFIDAAVVRIMKARKTIDHRALIGEAMAQLKFPATSADIKKRIESLIEREYMERLEGDRSKYKYLA